MDSILFWALTGIFCLAAVILRIIFVFFSSNEILELGMIFVTAFAFLFLGGAKDLFSGLWSWILRLMGLGELGLGFYKLLFL